MAGFVNTITNELPDRLSAARKAVDHELKQKHPDYKTAANTAKEQMDLVSRLAAAIIEQAPSAADRRRVYRPISRRYLANERAAIIEQIKQIADDSIAKESKLGELKVDRTGTGAEPSRTRSWFWAMMSGGFCRRHQIWQDDTDIKADQFQREDQRPRFAGEQQVTSAIYTLENPTKKEDLLRSRQRRAGDDARLSAVHSEWRDVDPR